MKPIDRARREWFGAVVLSESPGLLAHVDHAHADRLGLAPEPGLPEGRFRAPLDVHLALTDRCDLSCTGCYVRPRGGPDADMPKERAFAILDRLAALSVFTVSFGGGEPFLHPDLFAIAGRARDLGLLPNVTTNGTSIDRETAGRCRVFGSVHLSWHSPADEPRLARAAARLRDAGIRPGLNVLVGRDTFPLLPAVFRRAAGWRVGRILLLRFKRTTANAAQAAMALRPEEERRLFPLTRKLARRHRITPMFDCSLFPAVAAHGVKEKTLRFYDVNGCQGADAILAVDAAGRFRPCSFWPETCGRAEDLTQREWHENQGLRAFRDRRAAGCGACGYRDLCRGGCPLVESSLCAATSA